MNFLHLLTVFGATEEAQGIAALGIDPLAILAQAATFLVLFFVIKKFALDKIITTLEKRRQTIDDGIRLGQEMEREKERLEEKIDKALHKARNQADEIIAQAHQEASVLIQQAEERASEKVDTMIADAHNKIDADVKRARQELERDTLELVARATEVIIEEKLDANKDSRLMEKALSQARSK